MKKLMIAAAAAAMVSGAFATAEVYEYKLNLTTTKCAEGKITKGSYWAECCGDVGDAITYRVKTSLVVQGVTWGCYCPESLAGDWGTVCGNGNSSYGIVFWSKTADSFLVDKYDDTKFDWDEGFLNRLGKKGNEVEFSLKLVPNDMAEYSEVDGDEFELTLAGMGTLSGISCGNYIKSAKGSVAGTIVPAASVCTYCTETPCEVYEFCVECCNHTTPFSMDADKSVAFGTFTMKYNASASKKLEKTGKISTSYTGFSKNVKAALVAAGE